MIIGLCGVIGSGKDFRAKKLVAEEGYIQLDFKEALIDMVEDIVGFPIRENYELFKACVVGLTAPGYLPPAGMSIEQVNARMLFENPYAMTGRKMLLNVGTNAMRKRDPDYWVNQWIKKARTLGGNVVAADMRFPNECRAVMEAGTLLNRRVTTHRFIFCDFHSDRYNPSLKHESEEMAQNLLAKGYRDGQYFY